jgi:leader peptidase (prepilin peptidase) / N-methyltransferase
MNLFNSILVVGPDQPLSILTLVIGAVIGIAVGSVVNVLIHRVVVEDCEICEKQQKHIPARFPIVAILTGLAFVVMIWHDGVSTPLFFNLAFVTAILALLTIDSEHMILPDVITYPGIVFAIIARIALPYLVNAPYFDDMPSLMSGALSNQPHWIVSLVGAFIGALIGGGSLWLMGWTWEKLRGIEAMGLGDVKMMFMVGAYLGWRLTILTIFIGVLSGSVIGIALMARSGKKDMQMMLPFGVFLGIGAIGALLFGSYLVEWYAGQFR